VDSTFVVTSRVAQFCLESEVFKTKFIEKIETNNLCSTAVCVQQLFRKSCRLCDNFGKYCRAGEATDDNMEHAHCMLDD